MSCETGRKIHETSANYWSQTQFLHSLHSLKYTKPNLWYCETPLGINKVRSVVSDMLKHAGLDGFFTNHSLRRMAATRLFRPGANVKLIKEITGHVSNAVEKYEITSDKQRMELSSIIQGENVEGSEGKKANDVPSEQNSGNAKTVEIPLSDQSCKRKHDETITNAIKTAIDSVGNKKARVTITIDFVE